MADNTYRAYAVLQCVGVAQRIDGFAEEYPKGLNTSSAVNCDCLVPGGLRVSFASQSRQDLGLILQRCRVPTCAGSRQGAG
jgi:hypothetical protein